MKNYFDNPNDSLRLAGILKDKIFIGPKYVNFDITNVCNLSCEYCTTHCNFTKQPKQNFDITVFKRIIDDCCNLKVEAIHLSGEGEPLLHSSIKGMINYVKLNEMKLTINTNATALRNLKDELMRIYCLNINLSATNNKSYQKLHGGTKGLFNRVLDNILLITNTKKQKNIITPFVHITYILTKRSFKEMALAIKLAKKVGVNGIRFKMPFLKSHNNHIAITKEYLGDFREAIKKAIKMACLLKIKNNLNEISELLLNSNFFSLTKNCPNSNIYFSREFTKDFSCYNGYFCAHVNLLGDVYLCVNQILSRIGNVYKKDFYKVYNSQAAHKTRFNMKYNLNIEGKWRDCNYCYQVDFNNQIKTTLYCH